MAINTSHRGNDFGQKDWRNEDIITSQLFNKPLPH